MRANPRRARTMARAQINSTRSKKKRLLNAHALPGGRENLATSRLKCLLFEKVGQRWLFVVGADDLVDPVFVFDVVIVFCCDGYGSGVVMIVVMMLRC